MGLPSAEPGLPPVEQMYGPPADMGLPPAEPQYLPPAEPQYA
eukprot:NODE_4732_length_317_cov_126.750000_g4287_i0.p3 GENE.NODE_4732_length_317_cov_126.750000_g4287_i0~~NODE_4732_length_317_cov_126.750000_g4287_i0.p3  ORF type:complete len:50 (-),score=13.53 NODE_4732_length_317_cov_126.750000_g4287_i0:166-291(-)